MSANFPELRLRRLRRTPAIRALFDDTLLPPQRWCWPTFVVPGNGIAREITAMPGQYNYSIDTLLPAVEKVVNQGIGSILLFGQTDKEKTNCGDAAWDERGTVQTALRALKKAFPELVIWTDVCLCAYTSHGHCAPLRTDGSLNNDAACEALAKVALSHLEAGADGVAPSAMMDGQIRAIRNAMATHGFDEKLLMAYSAKFASALYGPFREAENSAPATLPGIPKDRKSYQASYANPRNAYLELAQDEAEGADILMVKPALFYLDIIQKARESTLLPLAAYNVSGEYTMLHTMAKAGYAHLPDLVHESLMALTRAGTDLLITYWANQYDQIMRNA